MAVCLTDDQHKALDAVISGHNIIILGQAGTGKSFAIREAVRLLTKEGKTVSVTASTGIAATQFTDGETVHRWAGILDGRFTDAEALERVLGQSEISQRMRSTDVLIIDEVSMISAKTFDQVCIYVW